MTNAQIQMIGGIFAEHGDVGLFLLFGLACWFLWLKYGNGKRNGNGTHKRVDKLGDVAVDNAKENAALSARFDAFEKQNEKEHNELHALIDKNNTRMHERFDEIMERLPVAKRKKGDG